MSIRFNKIDTAGEWMVDSHHLPIPDAGIKIEHDNIAGAESGRTEDGTMHIEWTRRDVRKVYLTWRQMSQTELDEVLGWMQGQEFAFKFVDRATVQTMNGYTGQCSYTLRYSNWAGTGEAVYDDVSINVIEM